MYKTWSNADVNDGLFGFLGPLHFARVYRHVPTCLLDNPSPTLILKQSPMRARGCKNTRCKNTPGRMYKATNPGV